jgi:hypothetical protein
MSSLKWPPILAEAAGIVESYEETGVTLRQLFYRLVAAEALPNTTNAYRTLAKRTAEARRAGWFPALIDRTRVIHRHAAWDSPKDALDALRQQYRRDRTEGQASSVYIGVEKSGMIAQIEHWFGDLGLPVLALGGYSSQTYADDVREDADAQGRLAVLLYAGDFNPSGEDIPRDFCERVGCFDVVRRVALSAEQVRNYRLPPMPGKATDSRAAGFVAKHGHLVQVELDALPPDTLRDLYRDAVAGFFVVSTYEASMAREAAERAQL